MHGQEQETTLGSRSVTLYPLYHPAAALYTPAMLKVLESDFARLPELLGRALTPPEPELALVARRRRRRPSSSACSRPAPDAHTKGRS